MSMVSSALVGPHDHLVTFPATTGTLWLRVLLVGGALVVAAFALLQPFLPPQGRSSVAAITWVAAGTGLLNLLLAKGVDLPRQVSLALFLALAVPVTVARAREPRLLVVAGHVVRLSPWVVALATVAAVVEFARAWFGGRNEETVAVLLHTGLAVAFVGLSWVAICRARSPRMSAVVRSAGWILANVVVAGTAHAALLSIAG